MMRNSISIIVLVVLGLATTCDVVFGQENLVPNPSFEDTVNCPITLADLSATTFWTTPTEGSPDYFNSCSSNSDINVPINVFGSQTALSGNAYIGISVYDTQSIYSYREYIQVQLLQPLTFGQKYFMSFYVSLADLNDFGIQELGAYFSIIQVFDNSMDTTLSFAPQIEFKDSTITDKTNWTKISGSFTANGNESYLLLGNFNRKQNTTAEQLDTNNINYAYYYIDNVCISIDSSYCADYIYTGIEKDYPKQSFKINPNPVTDYICINQDYYEKYSLRIYNSLGQLLYQEKNITINKRVINTTSFNKGILFINIKSGNQSINYKLIKQ